MKEIIEVFKIWAPDRAKWTAWAKPVMFARMRRNYTRLEIPEETKVSYDPHTMLIIDLPDKKSVEVGLAYAKIGYRLVPLYNGVNGPVAGDSIIDMNDLEKALYAAADILEELNLLLDAPPAFLLDSRRLNGSKKKPGTFDNRWSVFPQDMPSSAFLKNNGIEKIVLISGEIRDDLSHILYRYQRDGIKIFNCSMSVSPITVRKPFRFKSTLYRMLVIMGLTRNAAGGFGSSIPEVVDQNYGRHYGIG